MHATVIFHRADYDGIFCREIARKFLPKDTEFIGWDYGDDRIPLWEGWDHAPLYILDLSPECLADLWSQDQSKIIWVDHHKSAIDKWSEDIPGYRIDGVAACRLAWQWFITEDASNHLEAINGMRLKSLPDKQAFVDRVVREPYSVTLAGEYDIWDKRDLAAETFQYGLRFVDQGADFWEALLDDGEVGKKAVFDILGHGHIAQRYQRKQDAELVKSRSFRLDWEGLNWLVLNTGRFNSLTFSALDKPETNHDALMGFCWNGKHWTVSLYHAAHRKDLDLSQIAVKHGGGGHRGACGFTAEKLPWLPC